MQLSIEASSARGLTKKQLAAAQVPHFSSLDAGQYRGLKCERGDEKAAGLRAGSDFSSLDAGQYRGLKCERGDEMC